MDNQQQTKPLTSGQAYRRLLGYIRPYAFAFVFTIIGFLMAAAMEGASAWFLGQLTKVLDDKVDAAWRLWLPLLFLVIMIVRSLGNFIGNYSIAYVGRNVVHKLRCEVFNKMLYLGSGFYSQSSSGRLLSRLVVDSEQVAVLSSSVFKILISEGLKFIVLLGTLFYISWKLTLIIILIGPLVGLVVKFASKRFRVLSTRIQEAMGDVTQISQETIAGQQEIKVYGGQAYEKARFNKADTYNLKQNLKLALANAANNPIIQILIAFPLSFIVWLAINPNIIGGLEASDIVTYFSAVGFIIKPIRALTNINVSIQRGLAAALSIFSLLDEKQETDTGTRVLQDFTTDIYFNNVCFTYANKANDDAGLTRKMVLNNFSLRIKKGQTVALVGKSGGGKSTVVSLLPRFYDLEAPQCSGEILIDGVNIQDYTLASLRNNIALVNQKVVLFDGSVADNIAYGEMQNTSREAVMQAAQSAYADEFIKAMPQQYDSQIGADGAQLSGGQRQRIAIARAMLKNAPILILDEATSALDSDSERYIKQATESLMGQTTMLVIAHRLSTVQNADLIVVLDEGEIVEQGTHDELLEKQGVYAGFYQQQFAN